MKTKKINPGFILPLILLTLSGLLVYSTLVVYQAYYAYQSARMQYRVYQQEYALNGLFNQAVDACINRVRTSGHFGQPYTYLAPQWDCIDQKVPAQARIVIEPHKQKVYQITVFIGSLQKSGLVTIA